MAYCEGCLEKQRRIDRLEDEVTRLKAKLRYQERTVKEGVYGSSTPSSKVPVKANSLPERQARRGGAKIGHRGVGRASVSEAEADCIQLLDALRTVEVRQRQRASVREALSRWFLSKSRSACINCTAGVACGVGRPHKAGRQACWRNIFTEMNFSPILAWSTIRMDGLLAL